MLLISGYAGKTLASRGVVPPDVNLLTKPVGSGALVEVVQKADETRTHDIHVGNVMALHSKGLLALEL